jgi:hypothetical protein
MANFPSHLIETRRKDKAWVSKYIRAAWQDFQESYPDGFYNAKDRYHETKLYMLGKQPVTKYKKMLDPQKTASGDESWFNIDWNVIPIIPKFRRIALGRLKKSSYNINATAVDAIAQDDKEKYYADAAAKIMMKKEFEKQGLDPEMIGMKDSDPQDLDELEMHLNYSYKHQMASEMEQAIDLVLNLNKFSDLRGSIIEDVHDYGIAGYKEYFDSAGRIKVRRVNPSNLVTSYTTDKNFSDIQYCGEVIEMTITDLKQMAGDQLTEADYEHLYKQFEGKNNNTQIKHSQYAKNYDGMRIKVLDLEFFSVNDMVLEERINRKGNVVVGRTDRAKKATEKKRYSRTSYKVVYKGMWVVDSDIYFNTGLQTNMKRAKNSLSETSLSYHLVAPDIYQMVTYSLGEQMKSIADQIQLAWYKLQNVMLRARPRGIMIEIGALENVPLGKGGKAMKPLDIIDLYNQTGNLVFRAADDEGVQAGYRPITELNNGLGDEAARYFDIINRNVQLLRDILGFNEVSDASTPDPRMLKGVASLASESTNNALSYIKDAERSLTERLAYNISLRIQDAAQQGTLSGYVKALGSNSMTFFKASKDITLHDYGIFLQDKPDEYQKEKMARRLEQALQSNQITIADSLAIENIDNLKQAEEVLAFKIKRNKEEQRKDAERQQQMNAQVQMQSSQAAEQAKQQTLQVDAQVRAQLIQMEKQLDYKLQEQKYQYEMQLEQLRVTGRIEQRKIEGESREYIADIKNMKDIGNIPQEEQTS